MKARDLVAAAIIGCVAATGAIAKPKPAKQAPAQKTRFVKVAYDAESVVPLNIAVGRMIKIVFSPDETNIKFKSGDPEAWEKNVVGNTLLIRPTAPLGDTNMLVVTNLRSYFFDLTQVKNPRAMAYQITFTYPPETAGSSRLTPQALAAAQKGEIETRLAAPLAAFRARAGIPAANTYALNGEYGFIGARMVKPVAVYDDGDNTYLQFSSGGPKPAVFAQNDDGSETRVNFHFKNDILVVHRVARRLILRTGANGGTSACVINGDYRDRGANSSNTASPTVERVIKRGENKYVP